MDPADVMGVAKPSAGGQAVAWSFGDKKQRFKRKGSKSPAEKRKAKKAWRVAKAEALEAEIENAGRYSVWSEGELTDIPDLSVPSQRGRDRVAERAIKLEMRQTLPGHVYRGENGNLRGYPAWARAHRFTIEARATYQKSLKAANKAAKKHEAAAKKYQKALKKGSKNAYELGKEKEKARKDYEAARKRAEADQKELAEKAVKESLAATGYPPCSYYGAQWCVTKQHALCPEDCDKDDCDCTLVYVNSGEPWHIELQDALRGPEAAKRAMEEKIKLLQSLERQGVSLTEKGTKNRGAPRLPGQKFSPAHEKLRSTLLYRRRHLKKEKKGDRKKDDTRHAPGSVATRPGSTPVTPTPPTDRQTSTRPYGSVRTVQAKPESAAQDTRCGNCEQALALLRQQGEATNPAQLEGQIKCFWSAASNPQNPLTKGLDKNDPDRRGLLTKLVTRCSIEVSLGRSYAAREQEEVPRMPEGGTPTGETPSTTRPQKKPTQKKPNGIGNCATCSGALAAATGVSLDRDLECLWIATTIQKDKQGRSLNHDLHQEYQEAKTDRQKRALSTKLAYRCSVLKMQDGGAGSVALQGGGGSTDEAKDEKEEKTPEGTKTRNRDAYTRKRDKELAETDRRTHVQWTKKADKFKDTETLPDCSKRLEKTLAIKDAKTRFLALVEMHGKALKKTTVFVKVIESADRLGELPKKATADYEEYDKHIYRLAEILRLYCGSPSRYPPEPEEEGAADSDKGKRVKPTTVTMDARYQVIYVLNPWPIMPEVVYRSTMLGGWENPGRYWGDIPTIIRKPCPESIVIFVHGIQNSRDDAKRRLQQVASHLGANGYGGPVVGFSWNGDGDGKVKVALSTPVGDVIPNLGAFKAMWEAANMSGRILADIIRKLRFFCRKTRINVVTHSMGARVALAALKAGADFDSLQMLSPAVPLDVFKEGVGKEGGEFNSSQIGSRGGEMHTYFQPDDDALEAYTLYVGLFTRLGGEDGFAPIPERMRFTQSDLTPYLLANSPGGGKTGNFDVPPKDAEDDHSGAFYSLPLWGEIASRLE